MPKQTLKIYGKSILSMLMVMLGEDMVGDEIWIIKIVGLLIGVIGFGMIVTAFESQYKTKK